MRSSRRMSPQTLGHSTRVASSKSIATPPCVEPPSRTMELHRGQDDVSTPTSSTLTRGGGGGYHRGQQVNVSLLGRQNQDTPTDQRQRWVKHSLSPRDNFPGWHLHLDKGTRGAPVTLQSPNERKTQARFTQYNEYMQTHWQPA